MGNRSISIKKQSVAQLLTHVDRGQFAIPKLQREFVWDGPKAAKLLDSILCGMPIGVVMVWETPRNQRWYLRQDYHVLPQFNAKNPRVWFLIDGQQRISVLHHASKGTNPTDSRGRPLIDMGRIVLSLQPEPDGQQIRHRKPIKGSHEPLCDVLHPHWRNRLSHLSPVKLKRIRTVRKQLLEYPMHFMFIQGSIKQIRESFLRINTQGMKISTADAIFTRAEDLDLPDCCYEVRRHISDQFGSIPDEPILFALAALRGATEARGNALNAVIQRLQQEAKRDTKLKKKLASECHDLARSFGKAVDYLSHNFNVLTREYLYSDYIVSILALFHYWNSRGPNEHQKEQLKHWFWATTVGSRYSGRSFFRCIPDDVRFFKCLAESSHECFEFQPDVDPADVRRSQYASRSGITTAFYCMLLSRKPVSIIDDALTEIPIKLRYASPANRKNRHHIFARQILANSQVAANLYNSICNICLLTAEENKSINDHRPNVYLGKAKTTGAYFAKKMIRHLIPWHEASGIWTKDLRRGFTQFTRERSAMICKALELEAGIPLFRREKSG